MDILAFCGLQNVAYGLFHDPKGCLAEIGSLTASWCSCSGRHERIMT
jgi:hypothetical protein